MVRVLRRCLPFLLASLSGILACDFRPSFEGYLPCAAGCPAGCLCLAGEICVPEDPAEPPECCFDGSCGAAPPACEPGVVCPLGCRCEGRACLPPDTDPNTAYCNGELQDLSCMGPTWTVRTPDELRGVLADFAGAEGPHGISFDPTLGGEIALAEDLPEVTSLTFIDGGPGGFTLRGAGARRGLVVNGRGVILANLRLVGFPDHGVLVKGTSADVHLHNLRLGEPGAPNGVGLGIAPGARGVTLGRGRELACGPWRTWPYEPTPSQLASWDVNVVVANSLHGIEARGVRDLLIEGTWMGFDLEGDVGQGAWQLANGGIGVRLEDVSGAFLGPRHLDPSEIDGAADLRPACVAVGRSLQGGVLVQGGGDIAMECTLIGDTPTMTPWDENRGFGLRVVGNTGPVFYGPPAEATGFAASPLNLIHTDSAPAVVLQDAQDRVWIRGAQLQRVYPAEAPPAFGLEIAGARSRAELVQVSLLGAPREGWIKVGPGAGLTLQNCFFADFDPPKPIPAVVSETDAGSIELGGDLVINLASLCQGRCPVDGSSRVMLLSEVSCSFAGDSLIPLTPDCPMVDCGLDLGLDTNGATSGASTGCGPDIGAFECTSAACAGAAPCPRPDCP